LTNRTGSATPGALTVATMLVQGNPSSRGDPSSESSRTSTIGQRLAIEMPSPSAARRCE
jgi:hypothetical protein